METCNTTSKVISIMIIIKHPKISCFRSFNDLAPEQLKLTEANIGSVQERIKSIMATGAKINQVRLGKK